MVRDSEFRKHLEKCSKTVASWPKWKREIFGTFTPHKVICQFHKTCKYECGAKVPHLERDCEPCPFKSYAKCEEVK